MHMCAGGCKPRVGRDGGGLGPALWGGCRNLGSITRKDCSGLPTGRSSFPDPAG